MKTERAIEVLEKMNKHNRETEAQCEIDSPKWFIDEMNAIDMAIEIMYKEISSKPLSKKQIKALANKQTR